MENLFSFKVKEGQILPDTGVLKNLNWKTVGEVGLEGTAMKLSDSHVDMELEIPDDQLNEFTLTLEVTPDQVNGNKQMIFESEGKPISLYLDPNGNLITEMESDQGVKSLMSSEPMPAGRASTIRVLKYADGKAELEVNGKVVATDANMGKINNWGKQQFRLGGSFNGSASSFKGSIAKIEMENGAISSSLLQERAKEVGIISQKIKAALDIQNILVHIDFNEGRSQLKRIKQVMQSLGIKSIDDLGTLKLDGSKSIKPGDVLIGRKRSFLDSVRWESVSEAFNSATITSKVDMLNNKLGNAKSFKHFDIKKTTVPNILGRGGNRRRGINLGAANPQSTGMKWKDLFKETDGKIELASKTDFKKTFEAINPSLWPTLTEGYQVMGGPSVIGQRETVIIAKKIDLTNVHLEVSADVETLTIYAEELICGPDAWIIWKRPGGFTPARTDDPYLNGLPNYNRSPRSRDYDNHTGRQGGRGADGMVGQNGAAGRNAPNLKLWVKDLKNLPNIDLNGENGIQGGQGQRGGNGGNGEGGRFGKAWFWGSCYSEGGNGGRGGDGGNGGNGGNGGVGGNAGNISIGVLIGTLEQSVTQQSFKWKNQGGQAGFGGPGAEGGDGGLGGRPGNGEDCHGARAGDTGAKGQRGYDGPLGQYNGQDGENDFFQFTQADWDEQMTLPFITSASTYEVFPGDKIILKGNVFTNADTFIYDGTVTLSKNLLPDGTMEVTMPADAKGGAKVIFFRRASDNKESNRIIVRIKPQLDEFVNGLIPGSLVEVTGKAFLDGAAILVNGQSLPTTVSNAGTKLSFTMVGVDEGMQVGVEKSLQVQNPDGMRSNIRVAKVKGILEIRFKYGHNNLGFHNPNIGKPSWDTFKATFGSSEVWHETIDPIFGHPILTAAFYAFYYYFLKGKGDGGLATGFCTSMSAKVADNLFNENLNISTIPQADIMTELTGIHGKLLSKESLLYFHDCGRRAGKNIETAIRQIETTFLKGCDRNNSPLLFFVPSGEVWDSGYFDKLSDSHCIFPYKFIYPENHPGAQLSADGKTTINSLDGVQLKVWDCNNHDNEDCFLTFSLEDGELRYSYNKKAGFTLSNGITLAMMSNGAYNLADHDMPFSGPFGLSTFILDFLLSPADIEVTDAEGRKTGNFDGKLYSDIPNSHPCYLIPGAYLLPFGQSLTRNIKGTANGSYTYNSIMPDGAMIKLENIETKKDERDILMVNADATQIRLKSQRNKSLGLTFSRVIENEIRSISIKGLQLHETEDVDMTLAPDLSFCRFANPKMISEVSVEATVMDATKAIKSKLMKSIQVQADADLVFAMSNWKDMNFQLDSIAY
ncbi:LamG-like jellyroll fold domain-containing protein [Sphingobacterium mizutaii]|uniref:LamG-like jellyroll fold domain-containing protein n=1 Tax=Sphingobacterium mizutaii TaxID=1010 RepID=UPI001625A8AF|nr:LamG-like jellyroll fold domain-containing protein [Sphingobacterium mizutaii]